MHYRKTVVWSKAMEVAQETYRLVPLLPREETYGVRSQMTRAVVSVPCNIAEGWTRESKKEKAQFLAIAQGSAAELETLLTLCEQLGWFPEPSTARLRQQLDEVSRMLTTLRRRSRNERARNE
ncbi:four helix bundle protein [Luteimonas suaedae]|uniref:four helix bundle protein n=1 Tax=Luteimonas suaedae TaxID=2605430 RepID=UPI0011EE7336|nr:four helix bundle protein [Luteimonas suaedae]